MKNPFFIKRKNIKNNDILLCLDFKKIKKNYILDDIKDLNVANLTLEFMPYSNIKQIVNFF